MDGTLPTYEEFLDLTRRQAAMIETLRAEVERLKKELEEAKRAGKRSKTRAAVRFSRRVAALLRKAMALKRRRVGLSAHGYAVARGRLHAELDRLLAGSYTDPDNARLAKRLRNQRDHLLRFLDHEAVDATNHLTEREIRPVIIARELSAGNRTEAGAETHAVLASLLRTCRRQGRDILGTLVTLLRQGPGCVLASDHAAAVSPAR